jgi:hypothetical protein
VQKNFKIGEGQVEKSQFLINLTWNTLYMGYDYVKMPNSEWKHYCNKARNNVKNIFYMVIFS